jgi:hypothetical protein
LGDLWVNNSDKACESNEDEGAKKVSEKLTK